MAIYLVAYLPADARAGKEALTKYMQFIFAFYNITHGSQEQ